MITNEQAIELAFKGFKTIYTDAYTAAPAYWDKVAMSVPSGAREETYGWLGQFPQLREWLDGERIVKSLAAHSFTITNRKCESTVGVKRDDAGVTAWASTSRCSRKWATWRNSTRTNCCSACWTAGSHRCATTVSRSLTRHTRRLTPAVPP